MGELRRPLARQQPVPGRGAGEAAAVTRREGAVPAAGSGVRIEGPP
jgi:hypothetical protein